MTQPPAAPANPSPNPLPAFDISPETFWAVVVRRARYVAAILISSFLFCTVGWSFAAPMPAMDGLSLVAWQNHGFLSLMVLAALLLLTTAISSLLVHPDSPHMGLLCALLGLAGLSIKGGTIDMLIQFAQETSQYPKVANGLALECVQWALIFLIAEVFSRLLHQRFFSNTHWITRSGPELTPDALSTSRPGTSVVGISHKVSQALKTQGLPSAAAIPLALVYSGLVAVLVLFVLMQSQAKGQVLMATFVAFMGSTIVAYLAFPRVPALAFLLAVPLTACVGYLYAATIPASPAILGAGASPLVPFVYPGHASFFMMRALPIDYITTGVAGAILGYYTAFRWSLHSAETDA